MNYIERLDNLLKEKWSYFDVMHHPDKIIRSFKIFVKKNPDIASFNIINRYFIFRHYTSICRRRKK